ncbi:alpha-L-rhamnosidase C-terminal domain-containing protein [Paenibacillus montanisoli]|uniref:Alpha-rhamnosidase n=1 Tax=Paenibacillus montanisoli TaxID=2081970 RepID=A0A328TY59_9BACL|nr:alpha-L-rhamnosidase C-terminal domain-containing protein [Paenibacillus montanisoli]RAP74061.1 alpha-rhamnosidase [Paenibacillus montanisoli]
MSGKATWIWYPDDFEIWLHQKVSLRRQERHATVPPIWKLDSCHSSVSFRKRVELEREETILLAAEGQFYVSIDYVIIHDPPDAILLRPGTYELTVWVANENGLPAIYVEGDTINSDGSWEVSYNTRKFVPAAHLQFNDASEPPSCYRLEVEPIRPVGWMASTESPYGRIYDFGKQTFGYVRLHGLQGTGTIHLYYGESLEEALSKRFCETLDTIKAESDSAVYTNPRSRAFRYVHVECEGEGASFEELTALYEYLPIEPKGTFRCSDELVNRIWDTSVYTLHLNTREFFLDGVKRDRWVWSGDVYQSVLMNFYSFFDDDVCKRTMIAVRGKDPVETHLNHIMDYSFYWFISIYDYYTYTGDTSFLAHLYPKMVSLMAFCLERRNKDGFMEGYPEDWVFVDWAEMDNRGVVSTEQLLLARSLEAMSAFASAMGDSERARTYRELHDALLPQIEERFWDERQSGLVHSWNEGKLNRHLTKYPNLFAVLFRYLSEEKRRGIAAGVLLNEGVQSITTPYMRFYELAALCECGEHDRVMEEIVSYWGGMLDLGATTFWEAYDPSQTGAEHYAMYGRPFGKSLCHAWGASPLYLLGKYYLGVRPDAPGYERYTVEPRLGGLEWLEGSVPTPRGPIDVYMDQTTIKVKASSGTGRLRIPAGKRAVASIGEVIEREGGYEIVIDRPGETYVVTYG